MLRKSHAVGWQRNAALIRNVIVLTLAALPAVPEPARSDEWVQVATGGIGDPSRTKPTAMTAVDGTVYVGVHDASLREYVLSAEMRADTVWTDVTPPWGSPGEIRDMVGWNEELWVCTSRGKLWRRDRTGRWSDQSPSWARGKSIFGLAVWLPPGEAGTRLVAACDGVEAWSRRTDGSWDEIGLPAELRALGSVSGAVGSLGRHLYLGVGGGSAGSAVVQVWRFTSRGWSAVTRDGFGRPSLTWVNEMVAYRDWLYIGTAGHGEETAGVFRVSEAGVEDVTPCDLYGGCSGAYSGAPIRYGSLAVAAGQLFVGTRTPTLPSYADGADVLGRNWDGTWRKSNTPGFGVSGNDVTSGLGGGGSSLYACTINLSTGFEVWRRNATLVEMLPTIAANRDWLIYRRTPFLRCIRRPRCPDWELMFRPVEELGLIFDTARYSQDDHQATRWAGESMAGVRLLLDEAKKLTDRADKTRNQKKADLLRKQAAAKVTLAIDTAVEVCRKMGA